jgi:hypothetical protein
VKPPDAHLTIDCAVDEATVYVDDALRGRIADVRGKSLPVASGAVRVELRAEGYFNAYREVQVARGAAARVSVDLRRVPEGESGG